MKINFIKIKFKTNASNNTFIFYFLNSKTERRNSLK